MLENLSVKDKYLLGDILLSECSLKKIYQLIVSGSFLSLAKVGKCIALWSTAAAAVSVVGLVSYFLKFNGITTGVPQFMLKQISLILI